METIGGIWGIAQATNSKRLITACLPLLASNIPRIVEMKLTLDQMKDLLQLPSITCLGIERQLRLVSNWMDDAHPDAGHDDLVGQFNSLLPFMDLKSMSDDAFCDFMSEDNVIMQNHECRCIFVFFFTI